jgi:hypothetical protein
MDYFACQGGLDTMSPPLTMPPGVAINAQNFECSITGGYRRIAGYERYDGRVSPSDQYYATLAATITGSYAVGNTLTGLSSGATCVIIAAATTGFYVTKVVGVFEAAEELQVSAVTVATCVTPTVIGGGTTQKEDAELSALAADVYRADIEAVPGSGPVRGVWSYNNNLYAFRDNAGQTACEMHKASASGWQTVSFGYELSFSTGVVQIEEGDTVVGGTSGATGIVKRVLTRTGTWGSDAAGTLVFSSITGTFQASETIKVSTVTHATATATQAAITLLPGGRFQFVNYNFFGGAYTARMYGCDGTNRAFEFDGTTFAPISTGMLVDAPQFITAHKSHLFLSFDSSVQHSGVGDPYAWSVVLGASELALGEQVTGMVPHIGDAANASLVMMTRNRIFVLYGNSSSDWNLVTAQTEVGGLAYTQQKIGDMYWLDDRGVTAMQAVLQFGNFAQATASQQIQDWIREKKSRVVDSHISRESNQYRLFFNDGTGLYSSFSNGKLVGMMPISFPNDVKCSCSNEWNDGVERIFFGSSNGYVYQLERGASFDGEAIDAYFTTSYNNIKSPNVQKRYRKAVLEVRGSGYTALQFGYELGYTDTNIPQPIQTTLTIDLALTMWDAFTWDNFFWDGRSLAPSALSITGSAENIALAVSSRSAVIRPFTVTGMLVHYTPRRRLR